MALDPQNATDAPHGFAILESDDSGPWEWQGFSAETATEARDIIAKLKAERGSWGQTARTAYRFEPCDADGQCPFLARQFWRRLAPIFTRRAA